GTLVNYYFQAIDAAPELHEAVSDTFSYLAGTMLIQDDGISETILESLPGEEAAVRFNRSNVNYLTSALIRIYTDSQIAVDSIDVYVWNSGPDRMPRAVIGGPYRVWPVSTPEVPEAWTIVDMRADSIQPPAIFHVGLEFSPNASVPTMALSYDAPAVYNQSTMNTGSGFEEVIFGDFHIRAVVDIADTTGIAYDPDMALPEGLHLEAYPNPTNSELTVQLSLPHPVVYGELALYDIAGRRIAAKKIDGLQQSGVYSLEFGQDWSGGLYFLRLEAEGIPTMTRKIVYLP
ncbi:T9SS type A sorting domain-containing protein, partial [bacterium]|nr:T9SS type A sorting domain-containing protein [bacterium]